jgi:hypothetical protein
MQKIPFLIVATFVAAVVSSQTPPSTVPLAAREHRPAASWTTGDVWHFKVGATNYQAEILYAQVATGPEWKPAMPLPVDLAKAEQIARGELRKLVGDDSTREIAEFQIRRLRGQVQSRWLYVIRLTPATTDPRSSLDSFVIPVSFDGQRGQISLESTR